jgi:hypothetical protein
MSKQILNKNSNSTAGTANKNIRLCAIIYFTSFFLKYNLFLHYRHIFQSSQPLKPRLKIQHTKTEKSTQKRNFIFKFLLFRTAPHPKSILSICSNRVIAGWQVPRFPGFHSRLRPPSAARAANPPPAGPSNRA